MFKAAVLAGILGLAAATAEGATLQAYEVSGEFADGGQFSGVFVNDSRLGDVCPNVGLGCARFSSGRVEGRYGGGVILAEAGRPESDLSYQLRRHEGRNTVTFLFNAYFTSDGSYPGEPEFIVQVAYEYLGDANLDALWNGEPSAIGGFLSGSVENDRGYFSAVTDERLAPVPAPPALLLLGTALLGLIGLRRRKRGIM